MPLRLVPKTAAGESLWKPGPGYGHRPRVLSRSEYDTQRPGDTLEIVTFEHNDALRAIEEEAVGLRLHMDTAVSLSLELNILVVRLDEKLGDLWVEDLDQAAGVAPRAWLEQADAAYLRLLETGTSKASLPGGGSSWLVPTRVARLAVRNGGPVRLNRCDLGRAVRWERAALLAGVSMSEWALAELLS